MKAHNNLKEQVKAGQITPQAALTAMRLAQQDNKPDITKSDTYRWIEKRSK
jgi:hypothetical protein